MGSFSSKLLKNYCTDAVEEPEKQKDRLQIPDPRSPTGEITRTPITIDKDEVLVNQGDEKPSLMNKRILKSLKIDPRSPTDGISRTPFYIDSTPIYKSNKDNYAPESPYCEYSHDLSGLSEFTDLKTPSEPSMNVSNFDLGDGSLARDLAFENLPDGLNENEENSDMDREECHNKQCDITKTPLKVSSKPTTLEARKILNEILSSKEVQQECIMDCRSIFDRPQKQKNLSIHCDNSEYKVSEKKKDKLKHRTPLSNITLSSNSPSQINALKKPYAKCKKLSDMGTENSGSPKIRQIAEWDKDKTVII